MTVTGPDEDLLYTVTDGIGGITFNRSHARNAMAFAMYERLAEICQSANADRSIKVLMLTGAGDKTFASGTDMAQFRAFKAPQDALDYEARIDWVFARWNPVGCRPSRPSPTPAPAAVRDSRPAATCGWAPHRHGSAFPSRKRSAIACRCRTSAVWWRCSAPHYQGHHLHGAAYRSTGRTGTGAAK